MNIEQITDKSNNEFTQLMQEAQTRPISENEGEFISTVVSATSEQKYLYPKIAGSIAAMIGGYYLYKNNKKSKRRTKKTKNNI